MLALCFVVGVGVSKNQTHFKVKLEKLTENFKAIRPVALMLWSCPNVSGRLVLTNAGEK